MEPGAACRLRESNTHNIDDIRKSILERPDAGFNVMLANIRDVEPQNVDLNKLKAGGHYKLEVIGGLHTYQAVKKILQMEDYADDVNLKE